MQTVCLGTASEFVSMRFPRAPIPEGWLEADVEIAVRGFRGSIAPSLEVHDLKLFLEELEALDRTVKGSAQLQPRERQFNLKLTATPVGHIQMSGTAWSQATYGNRLEFELELDQTFLRELLSQLRSVLEAWKA
ncbi:MAG: hypothetical protein KF796_00475 [Ramlibacter sp.]|nr:hypothetical protein [Ramlibacter sp.]